MDPLEEIKARLPIEELVGGYTQLKKAGRNLKGLCPFHHEKTPSFIVSPDKGIAYCFGCQQGGDIFKFMQLTENCEFGEALRRLAEKTHVTLPRSLPGLQNKRLRLFEINRVAIQFFREKLSAAPQAKNYFLKRGLTEETITRFQLGYSPDSFSGLRDFLKEKGFEESEILEAGLLSKRTLADKQGYDRFRGRLMFPIFDYQDNPVGFGGRILEDGEPKYLNSPETPIYNKSSLLYGLPLAKEAIKKENKAIFVEGYIDVIAAHQAGTLNAIATSGTALTPEQLKLIKRYTESIAFAFDQDKAGEEATLRAIELAQGTDLKIHIILVPEGKDPDECIQKNPEAWKKAVERPVSVMDFYFDYGKKRHDPETPEGNKALLQLLLPLIRQHSTAVEQGYYLERLALTLKTDVRLLWEDLKKTDFKKGHSLSTPPPEESSLKRPFFSREAFLLGFILHYPRFYPYIHENLIESLSFDTITEPFYNTCKTLYKSGPQLDPARLKEALPPEAQEQLTIYHLLIEEYYPDVSEEAAEREIKHLVQSINQQNLKDIRKKCEWKIRAAESSGEKLALLNQYNEMLKLNAKLN